MHIVSTKIILIIATSIHFLCFSSLTDAFSTPNQNAFHRHAVVCNNKVDTNDSSDNHLVGRKSFLKIFPTCLGISTSMILSNNYDHNNYHHHLISSAMAADEVEPKVNGPDDGNLPDLPPDAVKSYLQYRIPLQVAADYYLFELQPKMSNFDDWGEVNQLFQTNNNRGQGQPNKIERDYTNIMRILSLSMPPDEADAIRKAQFDFERAMFALSKTTAGVRRDLPIELDQSLLQTANEKWDEGRQALNECLTVLNQATGLNELKLIPPPGPTQVKEYGRSSRKYFELAKKTKLCQNRGGPALSQAWGQLMVSGYMQDSCGIPDPIKYFYQ